MDYIKMLKRQKPQKEALVVDGVSFSYADMIERAEKRAGGKHKKRFVHVIKEKDILSQLIAFFACLITGEIPLLVPADSKDYEKDESLSELYIPENACMAVATSGTTGKPKILFRSYESWAQYFPIQNRIFKVDSSSRMFVQGSIAFTGNLNLYLAQFYAGGTIVAQNDFLPRKWEEYLLNQRVNMIYLIPSKLLLLPSVMKKPNAAMKMILSGSQSLGRSDAKRLKKIFPQTDLILYYGASELNYITYVTDEEMTEARNLIGKPFPKVKVYVEDGEIFVETRYHVEGIKCPYSLSDCGYMDEGGNLYFEGRRDDILNIRGRKISALKIENALEEIEEITKAAVILRENSHSEAQLMAFVTIESKESEWDEREIIEKLRQKLASCEMPRRVIRLAKLPKNASGKVDKSRLFVVK